MTMSTQLWSRYLFSLIHRVMGSLFLCNTACLFTPSSKTNSTSLFPSKYPYSNPLYKPSIPHHFASTSSFSFRVNCKKNGKEDDRLSMASAYDVLGVNRNCSFSELKSAFRSKVKQYHPDVRNDTGDSDTMIRRVIQAYEILSKNHQFEVTESECLDPFDHPECEAMDIFVNETLCVGTRCPYSCVKTAPHAFSFESTGTARATSQGHGDDYQVKLAVGQCPRNCIHYVTPSQRSILEELLDSILSLPYIDPAEADYLYSLITKGTFENNRYRKPKRKEPMVTIYNVDLF